MNLSCVDHVMTVCIHRDNVNLSDVHTKLDTDCPADAVGAVLKQSTSDGFCYVVDMSLCRSHISTRSTNHSNTVRILHRHQSSGVAKGRHGCASPPRRSWKLA